jgi:hypothetical protein
VVEAISTVRVAGQNIAKPGAYSTFDTTDAQVSGIAGSKVVALVADIVGGEPQKLLEFNTLSQIERAFPFGDGQSNTDMALMSRLLFNGKSDDRLAGTPGRVVIVKANRDIAATGVMQGSSGPLINLTALDWGAHTNQFAFSVGTGTEGGVLVTLVGPASKLETFDNLGVDPSINLSYTGEADAFTMAANTGGALVGTFTHAETGLQGVEVTAGYVPTDAARVVSAVAGDDYQSITVFGHVGGTPTLETLSLNGTTPVNGAVAFDNVFGAQLNGASLGAVTVSDQFPNVVMTFAATLAAFTAGKIRVSSASASDVGQIVQIRGLTPGGAELTEALALNGTSVVETVNDFEKIISIQVIGTTLGIVTVTDTIPVTIVSLAAGVDPEVGINNTLGLFQPTTIPVNDTIDITVSGGAADFILRGISDTGAPVAERFSGAGPFVTVATFAQLNQVELGGFVAGVTITMTADAFSVAATQTLAQAEAVIDLIAGMEATSLVDDRLVGDLDTAAGIDIKTSAKDLFAQTQDIIDAINAGSELMSAARVPSASGLPLLTAGFISLTGGVSVSSTTADVKAAIALLKQDVTITIIVPLFTSAAIHALTVEHLNESAAPTGRAERQAWLPLDPTLSKAAIKSATALINSRWASSVAQRRGYFDNLGNLTPGDSISHALALAGMQASGNTGQPVTFKFMNAQSITQDGDWTPEEDAEELLRAGLVITEEIKGTGFRVIRGITTFQKRKNRILTESSAMESAATSLRDLRTAVEGAFVGRPNALLTAEAVKGFVEGRLDIQIDAGVITAWRNVSITISGQTITITYEVAPVEPTNFVLLEARTFTVTQVAA